MKYLILLALLVGCGQKEFTYGQRVNVVGGFYKGYVGIVVKETFNMFQNNYMLNIEGLPFVNVSSSDLELNTLEAKFSPSVLKCDKYKLQINRAIFSQTQVRYDISVTGDLTTLEVREIDLERLIERHCSNAKK